MVLILILSLIILIVVLHDKKIPKIMVILSFIIPLIFLLVWYLGYSIGEYDFFISDETNYMLVGSQGFPILSDRFLYYLVNYWIINIDVFLDGLSLKIINIPVYVIFIILVYKIFDKNKFVFLMPIFLPYLAYLSIFNMRDIMIYTFIAITIHSYFIRKKVFLTFIFIAMLYLLRPFMAIILITIILLPQLWELVRTLTKGKLHIKSFKILFLIFILSLPLMGVVGDKIGTYQRWFEYTAGEGEDSLIESRNVSTTGNRVIDFGISTIRYTVSPMPHSLFMRLLSGGTDQWGLFDDVIRIINQLGYYLMLYYLLINYKYISNAIRTITPSQSALIITLLTNLPIYSYHLYGVTHQRLKLPFQIAVFLLVIIISKYKNSKLTNRKGTDNEKS